MTTRAERLDVDGQHERVVDRVTRLTGGNVDAHREAELRRHLDRQQRFGRPLLREVNRQPALLVLDLAGRMQMQLDDDVRARRKRLRDAVGKESRRHARHPTADASDAAIGAALPAAARPAPAPESAEDSSAEAGQHFVGADAAGVHRRTQEEQRVVDHLAGARLEIDGRDPFVVGKIQRQDDVAIQIRGRPPARRSLA